MSRVDSSCWFRPSIITYLSNLPNHSPIGSENGYEDCQRDSIKIVFFPCLLQKHVSDSFQKSREIVNYVRSCAFSMLIVVSWWSCWRGAGVDGQWHRRRCRWRRHSRRHAGWCCWRDDYGREELSKKRSIMDGLWNKHTFRDWFCERNLIDYQSTRSPPQNRSKSHRDIGKVFSVSASGPVLRSTVDAFLDGGLRTPPVLVLSLTSIRAMPGRMLGEMMVRDCSRWCKLVWWSSWHRLAAPSAASIVTRARSLDVDLVVAEP